MVLGPELHLITAPPFINLVTLTPWRQLCHLSNRDGIIS